jgi:predicted alpha-1,2-mannosidase
LKIKSIQNMRTIGKLALCVSAIAMAACGTGEERAIEDFSPADYVNPMIGASTSSDAAGIYHGLGKTFPGATTPYGMVQVSPNTVTGGDNGSGYSDEMKTIEGFAMTQMSGVGWYGDLGNFLVMPTRGQMYTLAGKEDGSIKGWRSAYDKSSETAKAGYYSVRLTDYDILAEATATSRCGALRFTFPEDENSRIQVDLARRVGGTSTEQYVRVVNDSTFEGWMKCPPEGGGWGNGDGKADYTVYFHARVSKPFKEYGLWSADIPDSWSRKREDIESLKYQQRVAQAKIISDAEELQGKHLGIFMRFPTAAGESIVMKVGISFVDLEGARNNFNAEIAGKSFDEVHSDVVAAWNEALSKIRIQGGTEEEKTVFYTALYHTMIDPRNYQDADGRFIGGDYKAHQTDKFTKRTIFSGWDVFRSQFPLQTIINPELVSDEINSLLEMAEDSGKEYLERWEFLNAYSGCMVGNPALVVIADAWTKGIRTFDGEKALTYSINTSNLLGNGERGWTPGGGGISCTLENAYGDWCVAQLARALGREDIAKDFEQKGQAYRNIFDSEKGWFRPRDEDGSWMEWPENGRLQQGYGSVESNPYQQGWFVPHDVEGMVELMGGNEKVLNDLEYMFEHTPEDLKWNDYYNHANEPVHFIPFLFNQLGKPHLTQKWTRFICANGYRNAVAGLVGNEDVGQMSAWYVLAASGIHPSCPGRPVMEITSPVFDRIEFTLDNKYFSGKKFTVIAHDNSPENIYIGKAKLNGKPLNTPEIDFSEIANGGTLELWMTSKVPE